MTYLVFVHGVATRAGKEYDRAVSNRDDLLKRVLFAGGPVDIISPLWGPLVPSINNDVYDTHVEQIETYRLGPAEPQALGGLGGPGGDGEQDDALLSASAFGKQLPISAVDAVFAALVEDATQQDRALKPEELEAFERAAAHIAKGTAREAFAGDVTDAMLAERLSNDGVSAYSLVSSVRDAVAAVTDRLRNAVSTLGFDAVRGALAPQVGVFLGDVFAYLKDGETRSNIRARIAEALLKAHALAKQHNRPLVLMGHSLGGVILTDMLLNPEEAGLPEDFSVASLITVGSQPGFFGALNLLAPTGVPVAKRARPACVQDWMNVFDPIDPFAFRSDMIFDGVSDLRFNSITGLASAHTAYFSRPQFYARTRKRLQTLGII